MHGGRVWRQYPSQKETKDGNRNSRNLAALDFYCGIDRWRGLSPTNSRPLSGSFAQYVKSASPLYPIRRDGRSKQPGTDARHVLARGGLCAQYPSRFYSTEQVCRGRAAQLACALHPRTRSGIRSIPKRLKPCTLVRSCGNCRATARSQDLVYSCPGHA